MGRGIRRVHPMWSHPKRRDGQYVPLLDESYESAARAWDEEDATWVASDHGGMTYVEYCGERPEPNGPYRPDWTDEERTAWQVYETVSEGTPISPVFQTRDALVDWLADIGDKMGIGGRRMPLGRERAEAWVASGGWAPSMVMVGGRMMTGVEAVTDRREG